MGVSFLRSNSLTLYFSVCFYLFAAFWTCITDYFTSDPSNREWMLSLYCNVMQGLGSILLLNTVAGLALGTWSNWPRQQEKTRLLHLKEPSVFVHGWNNTEVTVFSTTLLLLCRYMKWYKADLLCLPLVRLHSTHSASEISVSLSVLNSPKVRNCLNDLMCWNCWPCAVRRAACKRSLMVRNGAQASEIQSVRT